VGRIAYLSRRGEIWWFRRRHPAIFIATPENRREAGLCLSMQNRLQAKGHLAVSLGTTSVREARLLSSCLSADFERAWAMVETAMSETDEDQDFIDAMAMTITEGFRRHIKILRAGGASGLNARVREKAYAILEADLRSALNLSGPIKSEKVEAVAEPTPPPVEGYDGTHAHPDDMVHLEDAYWQAANMDTEGLSDEELFDRHLIQMFELNTLAFRSELSRYLEACQRLGRDPIAETPVLRLAIEETLDAAQSFGLTPAPEETAPALEARPAPSKARVAPNFTDWAKTYLDLRCQGHTLRRDDEAPHAATGIAFERTSLRNWQSSVRVFAEIVGDLPLGAYTKDEVLAFNTMIQRLPANFGKSSRDTRTARQVIEDSDETAAQALADLAAELRSKGKPPAEIEDALPPPQRHVAHGRTAFIRDPVPFEEMSRRAPHLIVGHPGRGKQRDGPPDAFGEVVRGGPSLARIERG